MVSVIMKCNIGGLTRLAALAKDMGCCYVAFQPLIFNGNLLENADFKSEYWIEEPDINILKDAFKALDAIRQENIGQGFHVDTMPEKTIQHFMKKRIVNTCFAGYTRIFVNPQGDLSFVCFEPFGNIKTHPLKDAWLSEKAYALRGKIKQCNVNCTQFCSERPESDDIHNIHNQLASIRDLLFERESSFLRAMGSEIEGIDSNLKDSNKDFARAADEINALLKLMDNNWHKNGKI
jgi:MoaA/NifB/PqqE/SkfB family radical SAM enzyme